MRHAVRCMSGGCRRGMPLPPLLAPTQAEEPSAPATEPAVPAARKAKAAALKETEDGVVLLSDSEDEGPATEAAAAAGARALGARAGSPRVAAGRPPMLAACMLCCRPAANSSPALYAPCAVQARASARRTLGRRRRGAPASGREQRAAAAASPRRRRTQTSSTCWTRTRGGLPRGPLEQPCLRAQQPAGRTHRRLPCPPRSCSSAPL